MTRRSDGIVSSLKPKGWLAQRWMMLIEALPPRHTSRLARGRALARGARVHALWFSPGLAGADVDDGDRRYQVGVRVEVFEDLHWQAVIRVLLERLDLVAALLEGELPRDLLQELAGRGVRLVPAASEVACDCDCDDYLFPCCHAVAVQLLLADALDGEPFLLLTLRGRTRSQLIASLRAAWHDEGTPALVGHTALPPAADWESSPRPLPERAFALRSATVLAAGLSALGPPPGDVDLRRSLAPLYQAGAARALDIAAQDEDDSIQEPTMTTTTTTDDDLSDALVDLLAGYEDGVKSIALVDRLERSREDVREALRELEKMGVVYRTGKTRGTRWWLG